MPKTKPASKATGGVAMPPSSLPTRGAKSAVEKLAIAKLKERKEKTKAANAAKGIYEADSPEGLMTAQLKSSGISYGDGIAAGMHAFLDDSSRAIMRIPYHDLDGEQLAPGSPLGPTHRDRFLSHAPQRDGKPLRYLQPQNSALGAYLPQIQGGLFLTGALDSRAQATHALNAAMKGTKAAPLVTSELTWRELADNPAIPLFFTEGEKKAACMSQSGFPTVSLNGVYGIAASHRGKDTYSKELTLILREFKLRGRDVYFVFDSDVRTNTNVAHALQEAAKQLSNLGAEVYAPVLPDHVTADGVAHKQGADDFIVHNGVEAFQVVVDTAEKELLTRFHLAYNQHLRINSSTGSVERRSDFFGVLSSQGRIPKSKVWVSDDRTGHLTVLGSDIITLINSEGKAKDKTFLTDIWLRSHMVPKYHESFWSLDNPGEIVEGRLNRWQGWALEPLEPKEGELEYFFTRHNELTADPVQMDAMFKRFAWAVQNPCNRKEWMNLLYGHGGTGKTAVMTAINMIFEGYVFSMTEPILKSQFHAGIEAALVIDIQEAQKASFAANVELLKSYIGPNPVRLSGKGTNSFQVELCAMLNITTNNADSVIGPLGPNERRLVVSRMGTASDHARDAAAREREGVVSGELYDWLRDKKRPGARLLMHYLLNMDLSKFDPTLRTPIPDDLRAEADVSGSGYGGSPMCVEFATAFCSNPVKMMGATSYELLSLNDFVPLYSAWAAQRGLDRTAVSKRPLLHALMSHGPRLAGTGGEISVWKRDTKINGERMKLWVARAELEPTYCVPVTAKQRGAEVDAVVDAARVQYEKEHASTAPEGFAKLKPISRPLKTKKY